MKLKNWRPVSLLCTDYKLLSKALATRLGKVMAEVIHVDQSFCVPGRHTMPGTQYCVFPRNWENTLEIVEGRVRKWRWIFPKLSYKGRVLVLNNLVSSMLWHRLTCVDPPPDLLPKVQAILVDTFWDKLHWLPQSLLYLQKEEGGHGLMHLASRRATFRLEFIRRFLTGPKDLVWKPLACSILRHFGEHGLDTSLFLLDLSPCVFNNIPDFYRSVFNVWSLFKKERVVCPASLYWLLNEPVVAGGRLSRHGTFRPTFHGMFCKSKAKTLGQVVELAGPDLKDAAALTGQMGVRSMRLVQQALETIGDNN